MTDYRTNKTSSAITSRLSTLAGSLAFAAAVICGSGAAQAKDGLSVALFTGTCANPSAQPGRLRRNTRFSRSMRMSCRMLNGSVRRAM